MNSSASPHTVTQDHPYTEINMSQIKVDGGFMGFLFAASTAYIFVVGIPVVRWFFLGALAVGFGIFLALRLFHKYNPARPFTSSQRDRLFT